MYNDSNTALPYINFLYRLVVSVSVSDRYQNLQYCTSLLNIVIYYTLNLVSKWIYVLIGMHALANIIQTKIILSVSWCVDCIVEVDPSFSPVVKWKNQTTVKR